MRLFLVSLADCRDIRISAYGFAINGGGDLTFLYTGEGVHLDVFPKGYWSSVQEISAAEWRADEEADNRKSA